MSGFDERFDERFKRTERRVFVGALISGAVSLLVIGVLLWAVVRLVLEFTG